MSEEFDFSEFDALLNKNALKEIEEASVKPTFNNEPLPPNVYAMTVESLALTVTKSGHPTVKCDFKIKDGEYKGRHQFYWLNLTKSDGSLHGLKTHLAHVFLNSLTGDRIKCSVKDGFELFAKEIQQVYEFGKNGYYNMKLDYRYGKHADGSKNEDVKFVSLEPVDFCEYE